MKPQNYILIAGLILIIAGLILIVPLAFRQYDLLKRDLEREKGLTESLEKSLEFWKKKRITA